ncbi:MAG: YhcH/YjgK/YiaL family protein [Bryobacteraceae bacterium]|nr:YhcH/YjgK/YiaL family protein [Bryobacteraceae bacterium]
MSVLHSRRFFHSCCAGALLAGPLLAAHADAITGKLEDWKKYPELERYSAAFEYLQKTDLRAKEPGRIEIDGNRMYGTLTANRAKRPETGKIEAHRKYLDIHYLIDGREIIGSSAIAGLDLTDPYQAASDVEFYKQPATYRRIEMRPGDFTVFLPGQGHMPGCGLDTTAVIRKVVIKSLV